MHKGALGVKCFEDSARALIQRFCGAAAHTLRVASRNGLSCLSYFLGACAFLVLRLMLRLLTCQRQVVPTVYKYLDGREVASNQYSVTEHLRHINVGSGRGLPGVWFFYEVSPVHAVFEETRKSWLQVTNPILVVPLQAQLEAIVSGVVR